MSPDSSISDTDDIRQRAEQALRAGDLGMADRILQGDELTIASLAENLRIYQAELEIQNAELRETQAVTQRILARYSALFTSLPLPILTVDRTGLILEVNTAALRQFSLPGHHPPHLWLRRLLVQDDAPALGRALIGALINGGDQTRRLTFLRFDGTPFPGDLHVARLESRARHDATTDERNYEFACAVVDLTLTQRYEEELRQSNIRLRESETRYRIAADFSPDWDYWHGPDGRLVYVSPGCLPISGHPPQDFLDNRDLILDLLLPEDAERFRAHLREITAAGAAHPHVTLELRLLRPDGELRWIEHQCLPIFDADGNYLGRRGVNRDITARKRTEAELRRAKEVAERAMRAKSAFLSNMSHELRTPMNAVLGFAQLLEMDPGLDALQRESVQEILASGQHLLGLINEVLDLARIETAPPALSIAAVDLAALVDDCLHLVAPLAETRRVGISTAPIPDLRVRADRARLRQVLLNFLTNAIQYNRDRGLVRLEYESCPTDRRIRVVVADTGPGIDPARHDEIFQPFSRLDADQRGIGGTGVGLSIARRLMEAMDGATGFTSTPGEGSRFWFEIPEADDTRDRAPRHDD